MWKLIRNNQGASATEFAIVILPVMFFMIGIIQTGYFVWANNLLHAAVDVAARCAAVNSTTAPCAASDMVTAANAVFAPLSGASFTGNTLTATCNGNGLTGTYQVSIGFIINLTLIANSCYPTVVRSS
jgi:Flp pilus assembly protein TadG